MASPTVRSAIGLTAILGLLVTADSVFGQSRSSGMCGGRAMTRSPGAGYMPYGRTPGYGYGPYSRPNYSMPTYGANPYQMYAMPNYGGGQKNAVLTAGSGTPAEVTENKEQKNPFTDLGLPTKEGHLDWPLALVALPGEKTRDLLNQVEALILQMAGKPKDAANTGFAEETKDIFARLRSQMYSNRFSITRGCYKDAAKFLSQLDSAVKTLQ